MIMKEEKTIISQNKTTQKKQRKKQQKLKNQVVESLSINKNQKI